MDQKLQSLVPSLPVRCLRDAWWSVECEWFSCCIAVGISMETLQAIFPRSVAMSIKRVPLSYKI